MEPPTLTVVELNETLAIAMTDVDGANGELEVHRAAATAASATASSVMKREARGVPIMVPPW
jgi:hypothetical protein